MKKQKIEDIFSSMENFSSVPPPELWSQIEEELDKPKKKKRAILWWSVAASLLLGFAIPSVLYFNSVSNNENPNSISIENNTVVLQKKNTDSKGSKGTSIKDEISKNTNQVKNAVSIAVVNKKLDAVVKKKSGENGISKSNTGSQIVMQTRLASNTNKSSYLNASHQGGTNAFLEKSSHDTDYSSNNNNNSNINSSNNNIAQTTKTSSSIAQVIKSETDKPVNDASKKGKTTNLALTQNDSVQLAELQKLENAFAKAENKNNKTKPVPETDKWSVQVFAGVSSSQNYKTESSLGSTVESKQGNAYGVKTNYKLNKKWGISSGFKFNELGQAIADVSYVNAQNTMGLTTSNFFIQNSNVERVSTNTNYVFISNNDQNEMKNSNFQTGTIDQSLKYIEMPLEVSYALLDKNKTSISLNTGGFVGKLISNEMQLNGTAIGENLNVNEFVYGSLLSSTVQYRLYKQTRVFVEPGMNYYINPLNNQSFNQFQWALNFGLNVSF
ncbi:hypothetical protein D3C85_290240 [compost metagenome]